MYHGVASIITKTKYNTTLFNGLENSFEAGRYHSWIIDANTLPDTFEITAVDDNDYVMAMQHKTYDLQSVQFHPESILTPNGELMLTNWLYPGIK